LEKETSKNNKINVNMAVSYGGRLEIVEAIKTIPKKEIENLTEEKFEKFL
jgi:undecaprenyl diphosphate synthase